MALVTPSAHDVDVRNAYFNSLDYRFLESGFSEQGAQLYTVRGSYNGLYGDITLYVEEQCSIPNEMIRYFKTNKLGYVMRIIIIQNPEVSNDIIDSKMLW